MMMDGMMGGLALLWVLLLIVVIALGIAALVWLVRAMSAPRRGGVARQELDRRYATGELSRDDYLERRRDLDE